MKLELKVAVTNRYADMTVIQVGYMSNGEVYKVKGHWACIFVCLPSKMRYGEKLELERLQDWCDKKEFREIIMYQRQNKRDVGFFDRDWEQHLAAFVYATQKYAPEVDLYSTRVLEDHYFEYFEEENQYTRSDFRDGRKLRCFLHYGRVSDGVIAVENGVVYVCTNDVQPSFNKLRKYHVMKDGVEKESYLPCSDKKGYNYAIPIMYDDEDWIHSNSNCSGIQFVTE